MSRIGKKPVPVGKAKITINKQHVSAEGPKGKLELDVHPLIKVTQADGNLVVERPDDEKQSKALHGLTRALLANMIEGVTNGYKKSLDVQGVGYKAELKGKNLVLSVGYANQITLAVPAGVTTWVRTRSSVAGRRRVETPAASVRLLVAAESGSPRRSACVRTRWSPRSRSPSWNHASPPHAFADSSVRHVSSARPQPRSSSFSPASA